MIISVQIFKHASSPWVFPAVVAMKNGVHLSLSVDNRVLKKRLKVNWCQFLGIEEVLEEHYGPEVISKLDMYDW